MDGVEQAGALTVAAIIVQPVAKVVAGLLSRLLGAPADELSGLFIDKVYKWRCANRISILERTQKLIESSGVDPSVLPKGFLVPFLEKSGDVEDPTLQEMWSRLLASAANIPENAQPIFTDVLTRMSPGDAKILQQFASPLRSANQPLQVQGQFPISIQGVSAGKPPELVAAVGRLAALGILEFAPQYQIKGQGHQYERTVSSPLHVSRAGSADSFFELSPFGRQFLKVVIPAGSTR